MEIVCVCFTCSNIIIILNTLFTGRPIYSFVMCSTGKILHLQKHYNNIENQLPNNTAGCMHSSSARNTHNNNNKIIILRIYTSINVECLVRDRCFVYITIYDVGGVK